MTPDATARHRRVEYLFLVLLALTPVWVLFLIAFLARRNPADDLSVVFYTCSAVCFGAGGCLVSLGIRRRRPAQTWAGVVLLVLLVLSALLAFVGIDWVGHKSVVLIVVVQDAETGHPLPNATVRLYADTDRKDAEVAGGRTDSAGRIDLNHTFLAAGYSSGVKRSGSISLSLFRVTLQVESDGYETVRELVSEFTGEEWPLYGPPLPAVTVSLKRRLRRQVWHRPPRRPWEVSRAVGTRPYSCKTLR